MADIYYTFDIKWRESSWKEIKFTKTSSPPYVVEILDDLSLSKEGYISPINMKENKLYYHYDHWSSWKARLYIKIDGLFYESVGEYTKDDLREKMKQKEEELESSNSHVDTSPIYKPDITIIEGVSSYKQEIERSEKLFSQLKNDLSEVYKEIPDIDNSPQTITNLIPEIRRLKKSGKKYAIGRYTPTQIEPYAGGTCEYFKLNIDFKPKVVIVRLNQDRGFGRTGCVSVSYLIDEERDIYLRTLLGIDHSGAMDARYFQFYIDGDKFEKLISGRSGTTDTLEACRRENINFKDIEDNKFIVAFTSSPKGESIKFENGYKIGENNNIDYWFASE